MEHWILLSFVVVNLLLYSSWGDPWGGWAYGPRYLIPSMAILSIFVGVFLNSVKHKIIWRLVALPLVVYSSGVALIGALTTNAVPPKIEAVFLHTKYNFLYNWPFIISNNSGSYIYKTYLKNTLTLEHYALALLSIVVLIVVFLLFLLPAFEKPSEPELPETKP